MKKTVIVVLLGISTVSLFGLCLVQRRQIQRLSAKCEAQERPVARAMEMKHGRVAAADQKRAEKAVSPCQSNVTEAQTAFAEAKAEPASVSETPMSDIAKMMKNPGMKDMIRAQQKGQLDLLYGSLFKCLQLSDTELEAFKSALLDRQMALVDSSMDMMNSAATPEEKKAATDRMKETTAAYDAQIKELLGDDNYAMYQSYEATQAERMQVSLFKGSLGGGDQISEEQEDSLIQAMHEERNKFQSSVSGVDDKQATDSSQFTPEKITKLLEENSKLQELYVTRAAAILTPSQLEQFKANQKQQQAMQEVGMKMAAKMFGQSAKEKAAKSQ